MPRKRSCEPVSYGNKLEIKGLNGRYGQGRNKQRREKFTLQPICVSNGWKKHRATDRDKALARNEPSVPTLNEPITLSAMWLYTSRIFILGLVRPTNAPRDWDVFNWIIQVYLSRGRD